MKFGICTNFEISNEKIYIPHLDFIKKCGFDYLELNLCSLTYLSDDKFIELKSYLEENNIPCLACNCFMDGNIKMTGDKYNKDEFEVYVDKAVKRASDFGVRKLVLGSGASRNVTSGFNMDKAYEQFNICLDFIINKVQKYGIELEIEHLNKMESNIITSFDESTDLVKTKNNSSFKSILDFYHFDLGGEKLELLESKKEQIGHIHFARTLGRIYPELGDISSLAPILSAIKNTGYDDTFSMECGFPDMENEPKEYKTILDNFKLYFEKDMVKKVEMIRELKAYNCSQCVLCAFADTMGVSEEEAFRIGEALGGGIAGTGGMCGAVTAMAIVAGYTNSDGTTKSKPHSYKLVRDLVSKFETKVGSVNCAEIKGKNDTGKMLRSCMDCIKDVAEILSE